MGSSTTNKFWALKAPPLLLHSGFLFAFFSNKNGGMGKHTKYHRLPMLHREGHHLIHLALHFWHRRVNFTVDNIYNSTFRSLGNKNYPRHIWIMSCQLNVRLLTILHRLKKREMKSFKLNYNNTFIPLI